MTTNGASPPDQEVSPAGRDEVVAAILDSASQLFAERGPAAASIRDIAAGARVNHGLVFRHFGNKGRLVAAVLDHLAAQLTTLVDCGATAAEIQAAGGRQLRVIARALLDGYPAGEMQTSFPTAARLLDEIRPQHPSDEAARLAAAHAGALLVGWQMFEPFLRSAAGLRDLPEDKLGRCIVAEVGRLAQPR
ncbi:TetR/AcrR family transcriptional regulator [Mycobacterium nebraskense]|uniref:TetR family transcriptional regulator n=1 Tax=Mycobacterium nebraskense TaxID=244292 RepID=A0A0F5N5H7_9MYCO|nr:TetR/AcrR family transcriptional regulator [Mycobacterium nebraskense]KKC02140.1 TetR family transcriptional regulator [Mycobacterium nebraskense]KLO34913.1 TetR family transcriptional regulator [Mycobacterium nebraskense]MBI2696638.1 TetR/AcrR family transcriptional regulator [Mycobacterium nebraskense]MCV7117895.1 TetR/AcrR family transcriptional regulator [Mycobacterium nebraskense]ORW33977.1 TetR family transcriptional regulator [Mycobacterium nebraskense]